MNAILSFLVNLFSVVLVFGILIISHELGHFWAARRAGVRVELFTVGFGPKLFGFQRGGTQYQVSLIPFGGAVKLAGEENYGRATPKGDEYFAQPAGKRMLILVMGSVHNLLLGFLAFVLVFLLGVELANYREPVIGGLEPGYPAVQAGLQAGDRIIRVAGVPVKDWPSLSGEIHRYPDREISLEVDRAGRVFQVRVTPRAETLEAGQGSRRIGLVGIGPQIQREKYGLFAALGRAGKATAGVVHDIFYYLGRIFTRKMSGRDLAGPLGIAQLSTRFFRLGWSNFLYFLALLSVNLAVVNLFPLPVFDGGHLFGVMLERISGRKPSPRFIEVGQMIGLGLVLALAVFVTYNDLLRIIVGR